MVETNEGCASVVPIASSQLLLDSQSAPTGRGEHLFAIFREFVKLATSVVIVIVAAAPISDRSETFCVEACRGTHLAQGISAKLVKDSTLKFFQVL